MAGVGFTDPDGQSPDDRVAQMVIADVTFSPDSPQIPNDRPLVLASDDSFLIVIPLPSDPGSTEAVYRIGFTVPLSAGPPPSNPPTAYLQQWVDKSGSIKLSSANVNSFHISNTIWSTRFRTHSAIADKFLVRMGASTILLVGDAAHIHSPAGGQGMNLGIRDAITLGPVLAAHIASTDETRGENNRMLEEYASTRRRRALTTIQLTKRILTAIGAVGSTQLLRNLIFMAMKFLMKIPFVQRRAAWNLSGLGNR